MVCPKCGNDMGTAMYCNNCNTYPFKEKEPFEWKKTFKITGIAIGCFVIFMGILVGIIELGEKREYNEKINAQYEEIYQEFLDGEYYSALIGIDEFQKSRDHENQTLSKKYSDLYQQIEEKIYGNIFSSTDATEIETFCRNYIEYFPNGAHITEVNKKYSEILNTLAPIEIKEAIQNISNGEYLEADRILNSIVNNDKISKEYIDEAQSIKDSISEIVAYETPIRASIQELLTNATNYSNRKVILTTDVIVVGVDRERQMLITSPVSSDSALGYDYSFSLEIYYGNMSNQSRWGSLSSNDKVKLNYVDGRFKIYANRNNSGYIDAKSIS